MSFVVPYMRSVSAFRKSKSLKLLHSQGHGTWLTFNCCMSVVNVKYDKKKILLLPNSKTKPVNLFASTGNLFRRNRPLSHSTLVMRFATRMGSIRFLWTLYQNKLVFIQNLNIKDVSTEKKKNYPKVKERRNIENLSNKSISRMNLFNN